MKTTIKTPKRPVAIEPTEELVIVRKANLDLGKANKQLRERVRLLEQEYRDAGQDPNHVPGPPSPLAPIPPSTGELLSTEEIRRLPCCTHGPGNVKFEGRGGGRFGAQGIFLGSPAFLGGHIPELHIDESGYYVLIFRRKK